MTKAFTWQNFTSHTVLTDDIYTYVEFFFSSHRRALIYRDPAKKIEYGDPSKYHYGFYWEQSLAFYKAAKQLPIESSPLASYYAMLNAVKALISYREKYVDDFVNHFKGHGLHEDNDTIGENLDTIAVKRFGWGVFYKFGTMLEPDFEVKWLDGNTTSYSVGGLLYNLAFLHRAYITTYTKRNKKIPELFIPLQLNTSPAYFKGNDSNIYLIAKMDRKYFSPALTGIPATILSTFPNNVELYEHDTFSIKSKDGARRNSESISGEAKSLNTNLRKNFQYIKSPSRLWYLKKSNIADPKIMNVNSMLIILAVMHRFSEIVRYKPEQLRRLMSSKENWLIHEFMTLALDQFVDEIAAEITGQDIMCTGRK